MIESEEAKPKQNPQMKPIGGQAIDAPPIRIGHDHAISRDASASSGDDGHEAEDMIDAGDDAADHEN